MKSDKFTSKLIINLDNLNSNYLFIKNKSNCPIACSIKANAYGLGASIIAGSLYQVGCRDFFVANIEEAIELRKLFKDINLYNFRGLFEGEEIIHKNYNIIPVVNCFSQLDLIKDKDLAIVVHIDTGLSRLGIDYEEFTEKIRKNPNLLEGFNIKYLLSHLSSADEINHEYNIFQLNRMKNIKYLFPSMKISLSNSAGSLLGENYHFDLIRAGQIIYGINPYPGEDLVLPVIKLLAPILQIKTLRSGSFVGYNRKDYAEKNSILAICAIGYADGLRGGVDYKVYLDHFKTKTIGKISMDYTIIDVTNLPEEDIKLGKMVEFIGDNITLYEFSKNLGTIEYEILSNFGKRIERIYIKNQTTDISGASTDFIPTT